MVRICATTALMLALLAPAASAAPATVPTREIVTDGDVYKILPAPERVYLAGDFDRVGPRTGAFASLDPATGAYDAAIPEVSGGSVYAIASDGAGGWYLGGTFRYVGGEPRNGLAHITSAGTLTGWDPAITNGTNPGSVDELVVGATAVYVAGGFDAVEGTARSEIAAVDRTTGDATAFNPVPSRAAIGSPVIPASVDALLLHEGALYVGGNFRSIGGLDRSGLAKLDPATGAADASWNPDVRAQDPADTPGINAIAVSDSLLYATGEFETVSGTTHRDLVAIGLASGTATATNLNTDCAYDVVGVPGAAYVGTCGVPIGGVNAGRIARITPAGVDTGFQPAPTVGNPSSNGLAVLGTTLYVGGTSGVAAVDTGTGAVAAWQPSAGGTVRAVAFSGGRVGIGGSFASVNMAARKNLAALDPATLDLLAGFNPAANQAVYDLDLEGGTLYAGGVFSQIGGQNRDYLAALDPATGAATAWNPAPDNLVEDVHVDGTVAWVGGWFFEIGTNNLVQPYLARLDTSTAAATDTPDFDSGVTEIAEGATGRLYVGGDFFEIGDVSRRKLAEIDATTGAPTAWDPSPNNDVRAIVYDGTKVYAGGDFTTVGAAATPRNRIAAFDPASGAPLAFDPNADGTVDALLLHGGVLYAGGSFFNIGSTAGRDRPRVAALDPATGAAGAWRPEPDFDVQEMAHGAGNLLLGGRFHNVGRLPVRGFAAFPDSTPQPNQVTASIAGAQLDEGDAGSSDATFTVTLSGAPGVATSVRYRTLSGSATPDSDFTAVDGELVFGPAETQKTVQVAVIGDTVPEGNEAFVVELYSPAANLTLAQDRGTAAIRNDDAALSVSDVTVLEGDDGTRDAVFTVSIPYASVHAVGAAYATADDGASAGSDYLARSGTATIPAGSTSVAVAVTVLGDTVAEPDEAFTLTLSAPVHTTLADATGRALVHDEDTPVSLGADAEYAEKAGRAPVTVTLGRAVTVATAVDLVTVADSAAAGHDFTAVAQRLSFPAGTTSVTVEIPILDDAVHEPGERFLVRLAAPDGIKLGDPEQAVSIRDDDLPPPPPPPVDPADRDGDGIPFPTDNCPLVANPAQNAGACVYDADLATGTVPAGGTLTTDTEKDGATPLDPIETSITTPNAGQVRIIERRILTPFTALYYPFPIYLDLEAPRATADEPIVLTIRLDATTIPPDGALIGLYLAGRWTRDCAGRIGVAEPDPCILRRILADGDLELTTYTSHLSEWVVGMKTVPPPKLRAGVRFGKARVKGRTLTLPVTCLKTATAGCAARFTLQQRTGRKAKRVGSGRYRLAAGRTARVRVKLKRRLPRRAKVEVAVRLPDGATEVYRLRLR